MTQFMQFWRMQARNTAVRGTKNRLVSRYRDHTTWAGRKVEGAEWQGLFQEIRDEDRRLGREKEAKEPISPRRNITSDIVAMVGSS
jgi:hypothetical protein